MDVLSFFRGFLAGVGLTSMIVGLVVGLALFGRVTTPDVRLERARDREYVRPFRNFDPPNTGAIGEIGDKPAS